MPGPSGSRRHQPPGRLPRSPALEPNVVGMAVTGAHALLYTSQPEELRAVLRDVFGWSHVDAGGGWLIFALPPAELAVHPGEAPAHQFSLMCDDVGQTMQEL